MLTEGGNDAGVDGLHLADVEGNEFVVTLFQGKYRVKNLDGTAQFPGNGVEKVLNTVQVLFDPDKHVTLNEKIEPMIADVRSLIRDGYIPTVRAVLCNNGVRWADQYGVRIREAEQHYNGQLEFRHFNHDSVVSSLKSGDRIDASLQLKGKAIVEDMNYMRLLVGRVAVHEIKRLVDEYGDRLLQRNIRRFLGQNNRVNAEIRNTLRQADKSDRFYFLNNGITAVCDRFDYNAFQSLDYQIRLKNLQIINGGQTCRTIQETLDAGDPNMSAAAYVMLRIYQLPEESEDIVQEITKATNSQNPVDLRDLRSNDVIQQTLALGMEQLGFVYQRHREAGVGGADAITSSAVAEAVLAIWREKPHQARFRRRDHFDKLYHTIFTDLDAAQALVATLILRAVEARRRQALADAPPWLHYASHHLAMLIGRELLHDLQPALQPKPAPAVLSHQNLTAARALLDESSDTYYARAKDSVDQALRSCYGDREVSLQQLAATFRRGDLMEMLNGKASAA